MKPALATITLFFFFFLFTFTTKSSLQQAATPVPVVDMSGNKLKAGASYIIFSAFRGGGLSFNTFGNDTCPHVVVVQEKLELNKGNPVKLLPLNPKNHVVYTNRNLNIKFSDKISTCSESGVWKISKFINEAINVATNGVARNQEFANLFMIEQGELEDIYKLKFCPKAGIITCDELGIFPVGNDDKRYVGLANHSKSQQLRVMFQRAD